MMSTAIVAYLALFATVGFLFLFASLLLGRLLRAQNPTPLKSDIYECGEPAIGPGSVQFDLRFYVVALVFLIFEVEVALFFPPATVFGKAAQLRDPQDEKVVALDGVARLLLTPSARESYEGLGVVDPEPPYPPEGATARSDVLKKSRRAVESQGHTLALAAMLDIGVFFAVLLVGFAYVWKRGDLDWVRAVRHPATPAESAALTAKMGRMRETPRE